MEEFRSIDSYERVCTDDLEVLRADTLEAYVDYIQQGFSDSERFSEDAFKHPTVIQFAN